MKSRRAASARSSRMHSASVSRVWRGSPAALHLHREVAVARELQRDLHVGVVLGQGPVEGEQVGPSDRRAARALEDLDG